MIFDRRNRFDSFVFDDERSEIVFDERNERFFFTRFTNTCYYLLSTTNNKRR